MTERRPTPSLQDEVELPSVDDSPSVSDGRLSPMSHFDHTLRSQFFLTAPRPCPYLPNRTERKLFTHLSGSSAAALNDELSRLGFRRSQTIVYRPACVGCRACLSTRIAVDEFEPTASQKRVLRRNSDLVRRISPDVATDEQYQLFSRYLNTRHHEGGMTDMDVDDFAAMVEDTPIQTNVIEYRLSPKANRCNDIDANASKTPDGELVAACLVDKLGDGLSLVYSFFEPELSRRSLGRYIILDQINLAKLLNQPYVYLGFWVQGSDKMDYKIQFQPAEIMADDGWRRFEPE
ncbi:MAG: arginyltransferase [Neomegalonema sp.]|nr:arginyltransferase [Neomegalonema sp.]